MKRIYFPRAWTNIFMVWHPREDGKDAVHLVEHGVRQLPNFLVPCDARDQPLERRIRSRVAIDFKPPAGRR
jgi:hypothetical protein